MKWNVPKILLTLLLVTAWVQIVSAEIIFEDDFEQWSVNTYPQTGWTSAFGYSSAVSDYAASSGSHSFKLIGGANWARGEYHTLTSLPDHVALEGAVYMTSDASTRRADLGFLQPYSSFLFSFNKVTFSGNEEIWWYGKENVKLGTWEAGKWYHVRVEIDFPDEKADIYINGQQVASGVQAYPKEFDWYQSYTGKWHHIVLGKWGLSTGNFASDGNSYNIVYLDDVKIEAPMNSPPIPDVGGQYYGIEGIELTLSAVSSIDPDEDPLMYRWDFNGDGVWDTPFGSTPDITYLYKDNGTYSVFVEVTDATLSAIDRTTAFIENVAPLVDAGGDIEVYTNDPVALSVTFSDPGTLDTHTASIEWGDGTEEPGEADEAAGLVTGEHSYPDNGVFTINITVTDDDGGVGSDSFNVTVLNRPPVAVTNGPYIVDEGITVLLSADCSTDADGIIMSYTWDLDGDDVTDLTGETVEYTWDDDFSGLIVLTVTDDDGDTGTATTEAIVSNVAPVIESLSTPADPVPVGSVVEASVTITDPGDDTITCTWDWGDGEISSSECAASSGAVTGSHTYLIPGVYTLNIAVSDDDGGEDVEISTHYIVIYDPEGGFVTGGGWIWSPEGAYRIDTSLEGKATFGFVSKYKKGATVPTGNTEFQFKTGDLNFHSDTYDWLVIAGSKAMYKGIGTINGEGAYKFLISAIDGDPDMFRIKIWEEVNDVESVIYDNQVLDGDVDVTDDSDPVMTIGGGSIVIHKEN